MKPTALRALADAADALARIARAAADDREESADSLIPLAEAARLGATSVRVLRAAIRVGELAAYGRSRDRAVRVGDLRAWVAGRRVVPGADDADIARRMRRLAGRDDPLDRAAKATRR